METLGLSESYFLTEAQIAKAKKLDPHSGADPLGIFGPRAGSDAVVEDWGVGHGGLSEEVDASAVGVGMCARFNAPISMTT